MSLDRIGDGLALRSKGDIISHDGTSEYALTPGSDGQILQAQSSAVSGLVWANAETSTLQNYVAISFSKLTAVANSIEITGIPQTHEELIFIVSARTTSTTNSYACDLYINVNTTSSGYTRLTSGAVTRVDISSNIATSQSRITATEAVLMNSSSSNIMPVTVITFANYTDTSNKKVFHYRVGAVNNSITLSSGSVTRVQEGGGFVDTTSAISSVLFQPQYTSFTVGSYVAVYARKG
jgi:hypothetical protein